MSKHFNEATRVQMPAMIHLLRLGYKYYGKINESQAGSVFDADTNILVNEFKAQFAKLNPSCSEKATLILQDIRQELDYDDIGKAFYKRIGTVSPVKLIDFANPANNTYHFTAEFTCKRDNDEFRPDITLFVNGLPLVFIEVKKPNNMGGMLAESKRMNQQRFINKKFRRFFNLTQLMIFSNNMEYDAEGGIVPIQGAFYCTGAKDCAPFNCFREENRTGSEIASFIRNYPYQEVDEALEQKILMDFNCSVIRNAPEYQTNLHINTPTNRILTSMCSPERLLFILKYGIAYVKMDREINGKLEYIEQKHIMRYQQLFAALAVRKQLSERVTSGVIWHTQGSGKTALSYYLNYVLTDYFASKNTVTKFYFIVDRIELMDQATKEFSARGLKVQTASNRQELMKDFQTNQSQSGQDGQAEVTVVNIQRFAPTDKITIPDYATKLQRIFIIDEAHRGYNPKGSFLANLFEADPNSIKIALTGTPLLKAERASSKIFGNYLHTYYYDKSIQDGYTLKIIREDIEKLYKEKLSKIYKALEKLIQEKDLQRQMIVEHPKYITALIEYIVTDFVKFRKVRGDESLGAMIICETSEQAKRLHALFGTVQLDLVKHGVIYKALTAALILHDVGDKDSRKQEVNNFKYNGTVDVLIVFNMLLTGFDAPRLKRLYLGRKLKDHNLLQAVTRVNRPYKDNLHGYIVDFADIKANFEETNKAYMEELSRFNDPEETGSDDTGNTFAEVIADKAEILYQMNEVRAVLFNYTTDNAEEFSSEISTIDDKKQLLELKKALVSARDFCNIVRSFGDDELKTKFKAMKLDKLPEMISEVQHHIDLINQKEAFKNQDALKEIINKAMLEIEFSFRKISDEELEIISGSEDKLNEKLKRTIHYFGQNIDQEDPEYITIMEAFRNKFKENGFVIGSAEDFKDKSKALDEIMQKLRDLQKRNKILMHKYNDDAKFARIHKRIKEENKRRQEAKEAVLISNNEIEIFDVLQGIKETIDQKVYNQQNILLQDAYFKKTVMQQIKLGMDKLAVANKRADRVFIQDRIVKQYLDQYNETYTHTYAS